MKIKVNKRIKGITIAAAALVLIIDMNGGYQTVYDVAAAASGIVTDVA